MNERIRELAEQAGFNHMGIGLVIGIEEYHQKFAELIVRECKRAIDPTGDLTSMSEAGWRKACMKMIDEHFGVE